MYATPTIVCLALYRGVLCCLTRLLPVIQRLCLHLPLSNCPLEQFTCYACKQEWCDVALFAIFENAHHAVNQVYFYESNSKRSANMAASVQIITGTLKMVFALLVFLFIFSFYQNLKKNPILGKQSKSFRGSVPIYKATLKMWNFEIGVLEQFCTACRVLSLLSLSQKSLHPNAHSSEWKLYCRPDCARQRDNQHQSQKSFHPNVQSSAWKLYTWLRQAEGQSAPVSASRSANITQVTLKKPMKRIVPLFNLLNIYLHTFKSHEG